MNNIKVEVTGVGFTGLLFITFLVLKLCGVITWSWWWVTAPLWIPIALILIAVLIFLIVLMISYIKVKYYEHKLNKHNSRRY